jgi:hypothetical protein
VSDVNERFLKEISALKRMFQGSSSSSSAPNNWQHTSAAVFSMEILDQLAEHCITTDVYPPLELLCGLAKAFKSYSRESDAARGRTVACKKLLATVKVLLTDAGFLPFYKGIRHSLAEELSDRPFQGAERGASGSRKPARGKAPYGSQPAMPLPLQYAPQPQQPVQYAPQPQQPVQYAQQGQLPLQYAPQPQQLLQQAAPAQLQYAAQPVPAARQRYAAQRPPCTYCGKTGHAEASCWTAFPDLRPKAPVAL